jgi:hypothetical protein
LLSKEEESDIDGMSVENDDNHETNANDDDVDVEAITQQMKRKFNTKVRLFRNFRN